VKLPETMTLLIRHSEALSDIKHIKDARKECHDLLLAVDKLSQESFEVSLKPPLNPSEVWASFVKSNHNIDSLDARQLRSLFVTPTTALKTQLIRGCEAKPEVLSRTGCLHGLINAYFLLWGEIEGQVAVEKLIKTSLLQYQRRNPVLGHFRRRMTDLFSTNAPEILATRAVTRSEAVLQLLKADHIPQNSKFGHATLAAAIRAFVGYFVKTDFRGQEAECVELLAYAIRELLIETTPRDEFYALMECLILAYAALNLEMFRQKVRDFTMQEKRLGDPRLPRNAANWALVKPEARNRLLGWLAKDSILFFFNYILPNNSENRRRKDFWLEYHDQVRDFQVALSDKDFNRLMAYSQRQQIPQFSRVNHPTTSAFLLRFEEENSGIYVVEFSETGNAAYIFTSRNFRANLGSIRKDSFELVRELKHSSRSDRIIHNGGWEYGARRQLAKLGIRR
jgi:hypothetical protein